MMLKHYTLLLFPIILFGSNTLHSSDNNNSENGNLIKKMRRNFILKTEMVPESSNHSTIFPIRPNNARTNNSQQNNIFNYFGNIPNVLNDSNTIIQNIQEEKKQEQQSITGNNDELWKIIKELQNKYNNLCNMCMYQYYCIQNLYNILYRNVPYNINNNYNKNYRYNSRNRSSSYNRNNFVKFKYNNQRHSISRNPQNTNNFKYNRSYSYNKNEFSNFTNRNKYKINRNYKQNIIQDDNPLVYDVIKPQLQELQKNIANNKKMKSSNNKNNNINIINHNKKHIITSHEEAEKFGVFSEKETKNNINIINTNTFDTNLKINKTENENISTLKDINIIPIKCKEKGNNLKTTYKLYENELVSLEEYNKRIKQDKLNINNIRNIETHNYYDYNNTFNEYNIEEDKKVIDDNLNINNSREDSKVIDSSFDTQNIIINNNNIKEDTKFDENKNNNYINLNITNDINANKKKKNKNKNKSSSVYDKESKLYISKAEYEKKIDQKHQENNITEYNKKINTINNDIKEDNEDISTNTNNIILNINNNNINNHSNSKKLIDINNLPDLDIINFNENDIEEQHKYKNDINNLHFHEYSDNTDEICTIRETEEDNITVTDLGVGNKKSSTAKRNRRRRDNKILKKQQYDRELDELLNIKKETGEENNSNITITEDGKKAIVQKYKSIADEIMHLKHGNNKKHKLTQIMKVENTTLNYHQIKYENQQLISQILTKLIDIDYDNSNLLGKRKYIKDDNILCFLIGKILEIQKYNDEIVKQPVNIKLLKFAQGSNTISEYAKNIINNNIHYMIRDFEKCNNPILPKDIFKYKIDGDDMPGKKVIYLLKKQICVVQAEYTRVMQDIQDSAKNLINDFCEPKTIEKCIREHKLSMSEYYKKMFDELRLLYYKRFINIMVQYQYAINHHVINGKKLDNNKYNNVIKLFAKQLVQINECICNLISRNDNEDLINIFNIYKKDTEQIRDILKNGIDQFMQCIMYYYNIINFETDILDDNSGMYSNLLPVINGIIKGLTLENKPLTEGKILNTVRKCERQVHEMKILTVNKTTIIYN